MDPLDLVRAFFQALNADRLDDVVAFYDPACTVERVFTSDADVVEGREAVRRGWAEEFSRYAGALPGGRRVDVERVAGIETGWGWVRAEWRGVLCEIATGAQVSRLGYSDFWIEHDRIRRHRSVLRPASADRPDARPPSPRAYPSRPIIGVGAVVIGDDGRVVLVKRSQEPLAGQWSLPGGVLELGETLEAGAAREVREETGLVVDVGPVVEVFDRILVDETGRVRYHFVLVDYLCRPRGGALEAGTDVEAAAWADPVALAPYRLTEKVHDVIGRALTHDGASRPGAGPRMR